MDPVLDRLELLERRVTALEQGKALEPTEWLRPRALRVESAPPGKTAPPPPHLPPVRPADVTAPSGFGPVLSGEASPAATPALVPPAAAPRPPVSEIPLLKRRSAAAGTPKDAAGTPRDLESWFGTVVLGRVGIAAVVLAAAYFAQLAYKHVGDVAKVLSLYALGGALVAVGSFVRARVGPKYVGLLWGGATAVTYIAGLAATLRYHIVPPWTGVLLLAAAAALGQLLSRALRQQAIATVSVMGALTAPFLLGVAQSQGPWLLLYAAAVHGWSAWSERAWGWTWARYAGLAGAAALAWTWFPAQGTGALPGTFVALHVFALTLLAPEALSTWRGGAPRLATTLAALAGVAVLAAVLLGFESPKSSGASLQGAGLLAGTAWLGLAALLAGRSTERTAETFVRGLGAIAGIVLAIGAVLVWRWPDQPWAPLASLAALAPLLLLVRRRVGAGDAGVVTASVLALLLLVGHCRWLVDADALRMFAVLPLALVPAAALVGAGRAGATRATGLALGAAALAFPFLEPAHDVTAAWAALGLTLPALWCLAGHERARSTGDGALAGTAQAVTLVLAAVWAVGLTRLGRAHGWPNAFDAHTLSALALAGVLLTMRMRPVADAPGLLTLRSALMAAAVALFLLAGGREVHLLTRTFPAAEHSAAMALFGAVAALVLALHARSGDRLGRAATAIGCLFAAALVAFAEALNGARGSPFVLALLGVGLACGLVTELLLRRRGERPPWLGAASVPLLVLGLAWFAAAQLALRAPLTPIANDRFLAGAGLTLLLGGTLWSTIRAGGPPAARWATGIGMVVVGYVAGLYELVLATRPLHGAWSPVLVSLYTAAFAVALLVAGFRWSLRPVRVAALVVLGIVVAKVGFYDLAASELPLRVLVTGVLGLVLLGSAYAYARRKRAATPPEE